MPRGRCHFSLSLSLQAVLDERLPEIGALTHQFFPDFLAGSLAPDAMRSLGKLGKYQSHFYEEGNRDTWGKSVSGMFETHPLLADPNSLTPQDKAFLLGYISHLTTDEAFRDQVTIHVHGIEDWRPIIRGLWSYVDELPVLRQDLGDQIDQFDRKDKLGFIDFDISRVFLQRARGWAVETDPWSHERVFLSMIGRNVGDGDKAKFVRNRSMAEPFLSAERQSAFVDAAVSRGFVAVREFVDGVYCRKKNG